MHNYVICTSQRSGKTWLARTLSGLGAGQAEEFITELHKQNPALLDDWDEHDVLEFFRDCLSRQQGACAGVSVQWNEFSWMAIHAKITPTQLFSILLDALGPQNRIILLKRDDVISQAISQYLLSRTGYGHSFQPAPRNEDIAYDGRAIANFVGFALDAYENWDRLLSSAPNILEIKYEALSVNPIFNIRNVMDFIGNKKFIEEDTIICCLDKTKKLDNKLNRKLYHQFIDDKLYSDVRARAYDYVQSPSPFRDALEYSEAALIKSK